MSAAELHDAQQEARRLRRPVSREPEGEGYITQTYLWMVSTERLERELKARRQCRDCHTEYSSGWHTADHSRIRCDDCQKRHEHLPPTQEALL